MQKIGNMIGTVITMVVALALVPTITTSVDDINASGTVETLADLIPLVYTAGVLMLGVAWISAHK